MGTPGGSKQFRDMQREIEHRMESPPWEGASEFEANREKLNSPTRDGGKTAEARMSYLDSGKLSPANYPASKREQLQAIKEWHEQRIQLDPDAQVTEADADRRVEHALNVASRLCEMQEDIVNRFAGHPPTDRQAVRYMTIRERGRQFAIELTQMCPASAELDRAIDKIDEAVMLANAAIARHE